MLRLSNKRLLALICFVLSVGILASCEKDEEDAADDGIVQLLSFGPTGAEHGDTIRFFGRNLNKVSEVLFTGNAASVKQSEFKKQTAEEILLVVPETAEKGYVTLKTPTGDVVSKTMFNLNVSSNIRVTSLTERARPGADITLTGSYLNWVRSITFARDKVVTTFVSQSFDKLVVTVPEDAQTGPLVVTYAGTDSADMETTDTLNVVLPMATGFSTNPVKHADNVTITGTDLDLTQKVYFTGEPVAVTTFVSKAATQLVVKVPGTTTKGKVTLEAASGLTTTSATDLDIAMPAITAMAPDPVEIDANLTLTGSNLDLVASVAFTGVATAVTSFVSQSPTQLVVRVPTGTVPGKLTLYVKNSTLTVKSATDLKIVGATVTPIVIYDNALNTGWEKWGGWGTTAQDLDNTEQPKSGTKAIKVSYSDAYGAVQLHPKTTFAFPPPGYTKLKLAIYGGAGTTATSRVAIFMKDATEPSDAQKRALTLVPGSYTTYEIPLSAFSNNPAKVNEFVIQNYGTANITIYIDDIWFE